MTTLPDMPPIKEVLNSNKTCILMIDVQHDFMEGGALAVGGADHQNYLKDVQDFVNTVRECDLVMSPRGGKGRFYVCQSRDYHPPGHKSFASSHEEDDNAKPFTEKRLSRASGEGFLQMLWPDHCVQGTKGSELLIPPQDGEFVQVKGCRPEFDSYSAFIDDGGDKTGLDEHLREKGIEHVVLFGLATDYCVFFSAKDAVKCGFKNVYVIKELCRGIDPTFDLNKFPECGASVVSLDECKRVLQGAAY